MNDEDPSTWATITLHDAAGNAVQEDRIPPAHLGHDEGKCSMWCQRCYFEATGAYEQPGDWSKPLSAVKSVPCTSGGEE